MESKKKIIISELLPQNLTVTNTTAYTWCIQLCNGMVYVQMYTGIIRSINMKMTKMYYVLLLAELEEATT